MGCGKKGTPAKHGGPQPPNPFIFELHLQWDLRLALLLEAVGALSGNFRSASLESCTSKIST